ncbi:MAG: hypothetical protein E6G92_06150 [Alphaproteobacteria bacterium]|nr:MAG: hypothetical protein E6G92_06150 [Alphaproteobacteria bacterium]
MNGTIGAPAPAWLRIVAALGLVWNLFGIYNYLMTVGMVEGMDAAAADSMPAWVTGAFAIAVFGGALGCVGLLMLKRWSKLLLLLSLLGVIAMDVWMFALSGLSSTMAGAEMGVTIAVLVIAVFLAWLAHDADRKGWLS